jgi:hypothetical protein
VEIPAARLSRTPRGIKPRPIRSADSSTAAGDVLASSAPAVHRLCVPERGHGEDGKGDVSRSLGQEDTRRYPALFGDATDLGVVLVGGPRARSRERPQGAAQYSPWCRAENATGFSPTPPGSARAPPHPLGSGRTPRNKRLSLIRTTTGTTTSRRSKALCDGWMLAAQQETLQNGGLRRWVGSTEIVRGWLRIRRSQVRVLPSAQQETVGLQDKCRPVILFLSPVSSRTAAGTRKSRNRRVEMNLS